MTLTINGNELPADLEADLSAGATKLGELEKRALRKMMPGVKFASPSDPDFFDLRGIERENALWTTEDAKHFTGRKSLFRRPGFIDIRRIVNIGSYGVDGPIALDFRTAPPQVVYLDETKKGGCWRKLSPDYTVLRALLRRAARKS